MRALVLGALLGCALLACCANIGPYHEYEVDIDANFTAEDIADISSALDEWSERTAAAGGVSFHLSIVNSAPDLPRNGVYIRPSDENGMCLGRDMPARHIAGETFHDFGGFVECVQSKYANDPIERKAYFRSIVLHETGHVLGLAHDTPPSVMTPNIGDASPHLTDRDMEQWCLVSGWC